MRSDIVPGVIFPDYELSDHIAKRRKLSERVLMRDEMLDDSTLYFGPTWNPACGTSPPS
jgi:hypothetical protein